MSLNAFRHYWREKHGRVVAGSPGYGEWRTRYVQNHVLQDGPIGGVFPFAGMAEFWLPGARPNEDAFATTAIYRERIKLDEQNFIDMDATISMSAFEQIACVGSASTKLVILARRAPAMLQRDFVSFNRAILTPAALAEAAFSSAVRGWTLSHVIEGSYRLPGGRETQALTVDCVHELWFDSLDDLHKCFEDPAVQRLFEEATGQTGSGTSSFVAEEIVFFDGRPLLHQVDGDPHNRVGAEPPSR
jgi:hypothetical protein